MPWGVSFDVVCVAPLAGILLIVLLSIVDPEYEPFSGMSLENIFTFRWVLSPHEYEYVCWHLHARLPQLCSLCDGMVNCVLGAV